MNILVLISLALGAVTFKSQYVGQTYVRIYCDEGRTEACDVTVLAPENRCEHLFSFRITQRDLGHFLGQDPMVSCGWCTKRSECAQELYFRKWSKVYSRFYKVIRDRGFRDTYFSFELTKFTNGTSFVHLEKTEDGDIRIETTDVCLSSSLTNVDSIFQELDTRHL